MLCEMAPEDEVDHEHGQMKASKAHLCSTLRFPHLESAVFVSRRLNYSKGFDASLPPSRSFVNALIRLDNRLRVALGAIRRVSSERKRHDNVDSVQLLSAHVGKRDR